MTLQEINRSIISGTFSNDDLTSITDAIKFARGQLASRVKFTLVAGSKVKFTSSRNGQIITGTVNKVNRKFIMVREQGTLAGLWRVPANMLTAA